MTELAAANPIVVMKNEVFYLSTKLLASAINLSPSSSIKNGWPFSTNADMVCFFIEIPFSG